MLRCKAAAAVCWFEVCETSELPGKGTGLFFSRVRKEPKVHQRFANLWTPGTIQSSVGSDFAEISGGSCRNRFCLHNAGVKALNRRSQDGVDSLKHGRLAHVRSQFSLFRRSPTHKNLPPATFCTSEHVLFMLLFARRKK